MKKFIVLAMFCGFITLASSVWAHPPSDIIITYDSNTKMLHAVIMHSVSNVENHYIKKVDVGLNGKEIISQEISRQDNSENQTVDYLIPDAKSGDKLSVEAYCSISGDLQKEIEVK